MLKENVMNYLAEKTAHFSKDSHKDIFSAEYISNKFGVKRNTISHYLNQMNREGKLIKINTRPVCFLHFNTFVEHFFPVASTIYDSFEQMYSEKHNKKEKNIFTDLIGSEGSLRKAISQIKTSVFYPGKGLPIMLSGPTGVGKSLLAQLIYTYCAEKNIIPANAPYIVFNCAQYFNNPELLSSNLFGYVKGAFTGADQTKPGMLEAADGGILFLDEVHRLNKEGQEKLFTFMDQGVFRRMGESDGFHKADVRIIFATTESLTESFLGTFLRRIPICITIPDLDQRGLEEKLQFIYYFLIKEAKTFNKKIKVSKRVIDTNLSYKFKGNIGELQNTIKYICASAFSKDLNSEEIRVKLANLPENLLQHSIEKSDYKIKQNDYITINPDTKIEDLYKKDESAATLIENCYKEILSLFSDMKRKHKNKEIFESSVYREIYVLFDKLIFDLKNDSKSIMLQFTITNLQDIFKYMETNYSIKFNGNSVYTIANYLYSKGDNKIILDNKTEKIRDELYSYVLQHNKMEHILADKMVKLIENKLDTNMTVDDEIFLSFYLKSLEKENNNNSTKAVILAHGYATASSIANVANRLLETNIFEAFDMPLDIQVKEIASKLIQYIEENDVSNGLVILFDTGSLKDVYELIKNHISGPVAMINNVSTKMALYIGDMLVKNLGLEEMVEKIKKNNETEYNIIYPEIKKQKAIVTSCFTGIGTALQLEKLLAESIPQDLGIKIVAHDYDRLKKHGIKESIFQIYDVLTIVGTASPEIENINYISLEDLISGRGYNKLKAIFKGTVDENIVQAINNNIVRNFSLERVIDTVTILDTDKILMYIEECLNNLEVIMNKKLANDKKIALYVHVSCMVERLVRHEPIESYPHIEKFEQCQKNMIKVIKESFSVLEKVYSVKINLAEIGFIYDILTHNSADNSQSEQF